MKKMVVELAFYRKELKTTREQTCKEISKRFKDYEEFKQKIYQ